MRIEERDSDNGPVLVISSEGGGIFDLFHPKDFEPFLKKVSALAGGNGNSITIDLYQVGRISFGTVALLVPLIDKGVFITILNASGMVRKTIELARVRHLALAPSAVNGG